MFRLRFALLAVLSFSAEGLSLQQNTELTEAPPDVNKFEGSSTEKGVQARKEFEKAIKAGAVEWDKDVLLNYSMSVALVLFLLGCLVLSTMIMLARARESTPDAVSAATVHTPLSAESSRESKREFASIRGLYACLGMYIVFQHIGQFPIGFGVVSSMKAFGLCVQLFFLLGGFTFAHSSQAKTWDTTSVLDFYAARLKQLHIPFLLSLMLSICASNLIVGGQLGERLATLDFDTTHEFESPLLLTVLAHVLGICSWLGSFAYHTLNPALWYNSAFYFFIAMAPWFHKLIQGRQVGNVHVAIALAAVLGPKLLATALASQHLTIYWTMYYSPVLWAPISLLGVVVYQSYRQSDATSNTGWRLDVTAAVLFVLLVVPMGPIQPQFDAVKMVLFSDLGIWIGLPILCMFIQDVAHGQGMVNKVLSSAPLVWLGSLNYFIFLFHWPVGILYSMATRGAGAWKGFYVTPMPVERYEVVIIYALTVAVSALLDELLRRSGLVGAGVRASKKPLAEAPEAKA